MKKQLLALALIIVVLAVGASSTLAYFTTRYTADNVISVSGVSVAIVETILGENGDIEEYPTEPVEVMPATTASKIVRVMNDGPESIWVRVKVGAKFTDAEGNPFSDSDGDVEYVSVNYNTTVSSTVGYWELKADGYYYYSKILAPNDSSTPIFTEVEFSPSMGNEYMDSTLTIDIYASAVQSANNPNNNLAYPEPTVITP